MKRIIFFNPVVMIAILLLAACHRKQAAVVHETKFCISDSFRTMITIDTAQMSPLDDNLDLNGEIAYNENSIVKIYPNSSGQIIECPVTLGDKVVKGQTLAVIKSASIAGNYSDLSTSDVDVSIAKRQLSAAESLYKSGLSSQREYEEAKLNYDKAVTTKDKLQDAININGMGNTKAGGTYIIRAPRSGYLVEKKVNAGLYIREDMAENMFTISDLKDVWVYANVYENDIARVKQGYAVTVSTIAYPDKFFAGTIDNISQVIDPLNKALKVRIRLDNSELLLKPEMFAKVHLTHASGQEMLSVPNTAIIENTGQKFVVVYNTGCDLVPQPVSIKKVATDKTFITSGLQPGQKIVTRHALELFNQLLSE